MFKGFKTLIFSMLLAFAGVLQQSDIVDLIPDKYRGLFVAFVALVVAVLRIFTDTKIGQKE